MSPSSPVMTTEEHQLINDLISKEVGLHFSEARKEILASRLAVRLKELKLPRYMDYYYHLSFAANRSAEIMKMVTCLTNNESYFFREKHHFDILLELIRNNRANGNGGEFRILSAGCSAGEEPYTMNIYLRNHLPSIESVRVDAFDLDPVRIELAQKGSYGKSSLRNMEEELVGRYFRSSDNGSYHLKEKYREVSFSWGNIMETRTFNTSYLYDAVFCRNVLIYFSQESLRKAIGNLARCIRENGILFLGHSESIIGVSRFFKPERHGDCIVYRRSGD